MLTPAHGLTSWFCWSQFLFRAIKVEVAFLALLHAESVELDRAFQDTSVRNMGLSAGFWSASPANKQLPGLPEPAGLL